MDNEFTQCGGALSGPVDVESGWWACTGIAFPVVGVAIAAFCVWLAVRILNRHERWAKRTAMLLVVVMAYPASFGPACWISSRTNFGRSLVSAAYRPLTWTFGDPQSIRSPQREKIGATLQSYSRLLANDGWGWLPSWQFDEARGVIIFTGKWEWGLLPPAPEA
jgi:hypothetical protein